jgi:hypothetical protein
MKPYYRGFFAAIALIVVAIVAHSLRLTALVSPDVLPNVLNADSFYLFAYYLPMAVAGTISLFVAWRYWGWLFRERER